MASRCVESQHVLDGGGRSCLQKQRFAVDVGLKLLLMSCGIPLGCCCASIPTLVRQAFLFDKHSGHLPGRVLQCSHVQQMPGTECDGVSGGKPCVRAVCQTSAPSIRLPRLSSNMHCASGVLSGASHIGISLKSGFKCQSVVVVAVCPRLNPRQGADSVVLAGLPAVTRCWP